MEEKVLPIEQPVASIGVPITTENIQSILDGYLGGEDSINLVKIASQIQKTDRIIYCTQNFYRYKDGCYRFLEETEMVRVVKDILKKNFTTHRAHEVIEALKADIFIKSEYLNRASLLNLNNGLFDLGLMELRPHTPDVYSTIQLNVAYNSEAKCPIWLKALDDIFEGSEEKMSILQEFFGLCLTRETKYEKALICIGEGANGKSVVLYILQQMLGEANYSSVSLECFKDQHYLADLFGMLANISIEANAKTSVYDSIFKAIVSGDSIQADAKYKKPIKFRPFCKLAIALNSLPRVDDKSDAFFRRLLILRFSRQFKEEEQDKILKFKLAEELDGIFLWSLGGLKRLMERGYFNICEDIRSEIDEYRMQNNNVMSFVAAECSTDKEHRVSKVELYQKYCDWCKSSGCRSVSKINFGKELLKQLTGIEDGRDADCRYWEGICLKQGEGLIFDKNDDNISIPF